MDELPLDRMWEDDRVWLLHVLRGGRIEGAFWYDEDYNKLVRWDVKPGDSKAIDYG